MGARLGTASLVLLTLAACGGGSGGGFATGGEPLRILLSSVDPGAPGVQASDLGDESGESILLVRDPNGLVLSDGRIEIPLEGGYGGPYVITVVQGQLPLGIAPEDGLDPVSGAFRHHLAGIVRESGHFAFRLQVVDKGGDPFMSAVKDVTWDVAIGEVRIVDADPPVIPRGTLDKDQDGISENPDYDALKSVIYNQFTAINLIVAGGTPPYSCQVVEDPNNPDSQDLPTGMSIPPNSTSIVGAAGAVKPGGFIFTIEATDALGRKGRRTFQWLVDTPAILIATAAFENGRCGTTFSETIQIVDGVPPFQFELVHEDVDRDAEGEPTVVYQAPDPPTITPAGCLQKIGIADYPAPSAPGPDYTAYRTPPEGVFLGDVENSPLAGLGSVTGIPRRRGTFHVIVHVVSSLLPNERGQHAWQAYTFSCADSEPPSGNAPAFGQNPAYTLEGVFKASPPYSRIPDAEVSLNYNPDATTHPALGLQILGVGGVAKDGLTDGPHSSQVTNIEGTEVGQESPGTYDWTANWNPPGDGDVFTTIPTAMEFVNHLGVLRVTNPNALVRQGIQGVAFTVTDQQLPTSHVNTQTVSLSVGPDRVVVTESTTSETTTYYGYWSMSDHAMRLRMCDPFAVGPTVRDLQGSDLSATTTIPATTSLASTAVAQLLSAKTDAGTAVDTNRVFDFLRVTVNPVGWWNDLHGLNPNGARPMQHADANKGYNNYGNGYYSIGNGSASWQPNATAVELPNCTSAAVTADPSAGVYKDGGQLYVFTSQQYFGAFIVRRDGSIYVPCAFDRTTYGGFGDAWVQGYAASQNTYLRMPSLTVSPDGRFAAMKLKVSQTSMFDSAASTPIVVFSLTGEQPFGGNAYKVIATGSSGGSTSGGTYLYAPSMAMTGRFLYYLCGNFSTGYESCWHGHFIYRYELTDSSGSVTATEAAGSLLQPASADSAWTQTASVPMQTPFHKWESIGSSTLTADLYGYDGANFIENSAAPMPFRVSRNGKAMLIIAGSDPQTTSGVDVMSHHVWMDYDGGGPKRLSSVRRRSPAGATRGYALVYGPNSYPHWGRYSGPGTCMEISDDGLKAAVVCNRYSTSSTVSVLTTTPVWYQAREDIVAWRTGDQWSSATEIQVTGDDAGSSRIFGSNAYWRFGALVFTRDNAGLVFWGGCSSYYANSATYYYQDCVQQTGTLYAVNLQSAGPGTTGVSVYGILATADGGSSDGITSSAYTSSSQYNPSSLAAGSYSATAGVLKPVGGFLSANGNFFYLMNSGALSTANYANYRLVGVNVRSVNTGQNINGNTDFRGFAVPNWPSQRGFVPSYYGYYPYYEMFYYKYAYGGFNTMGGLQVMGRIGGTVFFGSHWQQSSYNYTGSYTYGGPLYATGAFDYGMYLGQVHCFDANIGGPVQKVTTFTGDTATYTARTIQYVFPAKDGSKVAFIQNNYPSNIVDRNQENLYVVTDTRLNSSGGLVPSSLSQFNVSGQGRVSTSFAFDFFGDKIYYAVGTGNENNKQLMEASLTPGSNGQLPTPRAVGSAARWYEVLHAGR